MRVKAIWMLDPLACKERRRSDLFMIKPSLIRFPFVRGALNERSLRSDGTATLVSHGLGDPRQKTV